MTKTTRVGGREALLHKVVFDVRYRFGFSYLDSCGRTANTIMREFPEWFLRSDSPNPQNAPLVSLRNGCLFNFSALKYDLSLERPTGEAPLLEDNVAQFSSQAESLHAIIIDNLGLEVFTRMGCRAWYLFPCSSKEDSEEWLMGLGCYSIFDSLVKAFGSRVDSTSMSVVILGEDRKYRIAFNGVERRAEIDMGQGILGVRPRDLHEGQHKFLVEQQRLKTRIRQSPEFAAMIDVDAFLEDPQVIGPKNFIDTSLERFLPFLEKALA